MRDAPAPVAAADAATWCWMCDRGRTASPRASEHVFPQGLARRIEESVRLR